jgi:hypothetical protein
MPRLGLFNMMLGFCVLAIAAAAGAFVATDLTQGFVHDKELIDSWQLMLDKSAHGHTNLFALLHICFGLTLPYSSWKARFKMAQTAGLLLGTLAMGPGMMVKARILPHDGNNIIDILIGCMLSAALATLFSHSLGMGMKWYRRT